eukprot:6176908-Pleurochrysis_carterae.AAC.2
MHRKVAELITARPVARTTQSRARRETAQQGRVASCLQTRRAQPQGVLTVYRADTATRGKCARVCPKPQECATCSISRPVHDQTRAMHCKGHHIQGPIWSIAVSNKEVAIATAETCTGDSGQNQSSSAQSEELLSSVGVSPTRQNKARPWNSSG